MIMASINYKLVVFYLLLLSTTMVESSNNGVNGGNGFTVDLIHRDSPRSPSYDSSITRFQRQRSAFDRAFSRKTSFTAKSSSAEIDAPIRPADGEYMMKFKIGTPPVEQVGIADTGSDLTWIQCKPCVECFKQNLPIFDPSRSSSYRRLPCETVKCGAASGYPKCDGDDRNCGYSVGYGDNSGSSGDVAVETLTLDGGVSFPKVAIGCGHENEGTFGQTGSGIVGLGGGSISIINQLKRSTAGKFSYCLASLSSNATSKISFGKNAVVAGANVVSTPIVKKSPSTFYYLTLRGMSVGDVKTKTTDDGGDGDGDGDGDGNIIIDSGTTLSFVPEVIFERVVATLARKVKGRRVADPQGTFKLCYNTTSSVIENLPSITAHFKGADVVLPKENIFVEVEKGLSCLAMVPSDDMGIFGNLHQINYHIGYDLVKGQVSFQPTDCSKPH